MSREREVREIIADLAALNVRMSALEGAFGSGVTFHLAANSLKTAHGFLGSMLQRAMVLDAQLPLEHNHATSGVYGGCQACFTDWSVSTEEALRRAEVVASRVTPERAIQLSGDPNIWLDEPPAGG